MGSLGWVRRCGACCALLVATPAAAELRDYCPDRPGLGTPACIVDKGHVSVELGLGDWALDRQPGSRTDALVFGDLLVRYGLTDRLEAQIGWTALGHVRVRDRMTGAIDHATGTGDIFLALRRNLISPDGSGVSVAVMPFATVPAGTAPLTADDWGAGLIVPLSFELPEGLALGLTPSIEAAVDEDGNGRHLAFGSVIGLDVPLAETLGATIELSASRDEDPGGHSTELLGGLSFGWTPAEALQFDAGVNLGLNRATPDMEFYLGIARRF